MAIDLVHAPISVQCFIHVKINFEKKNPVLHIEKFPFLVLTRNAVMLYNTLLSSFRSIICIVVVCGRLKTTENIELLLIAVAYERWSLTRGFKYSDLTWKLVFF